MTKAKGQRRWLREPLLHFVLLGAGLFIFWRVVGGRLAEGPDRIVIPSGQIQRAVEVFASIHLRPPDADELRELVEQEIATEVYYRQAQAMGLDRDDEIIRRRLRQKLQFLTEDMLDETPATDAELQRYLDRHANDFGAEDRIAFSQIYLDPEKHQGLARDAKRLIDQCNAGDGRIDYAAASDPLPISNDFEAKPMHEIAGLFGREFAASLAQLPLGRWTGPVYSGYGPHIVLVRQREPGRPPRLSQVRAAVLREWQHARRIQANREAYRQMRAKYKITVEMPAEFGPAAGSAGLQAGR